MRETKDPEKSLIVQVESKPHPLRRHERSNFVYAMTKWCSIKPENKASTACTGDLPSLFVSSLPMDDRSTLYAATVEKKLFSKKMDYVSGLKALMQKQSPLPNVEWPRTIQNAAYLQIESTIETEAINTIKARMLKLVFDSAPSERCTKKYYNIHDEKDRNFQERLHTTDILERIQRIFKKLPNDKKIIFYNCLVFGGAKNSDELPEILEKLVGCLPTHCNRNIFKLTGQARMKASTKDMVKFSRLGNRFEDKLQNINPNDLFELISDLKLLYQYLEKTQPLEKPTLYDKAMSSRAGNFLLSLRMQLLGVLKHLQDEQVLHAYTSLQMCSKHFDHIVAPSTNRLTVWNKTEKPSPKPLWGLSPIWQKLTGKNRLRVTLKTVCEEKLSPHSPPGRLPQRGTHDPKPSRDVVGNRPPSRIITVSSLKIACLSRIHVQNFCKNLLALWLSFIMLYDRQCIERIIRLQTCILSLYPYDLLTWSNLSTNDTHESSCLDNILGGC